MHPHKPFLIVIQSTDSPIKEHMEKGIWERQQFTLRQYANVYSVCYYTCDVKNFQQHMPAGVTHVNPFIASSRFFFKHIFYYLFLIGSSIKWRKKELIIRTIGVNLPVMPLVKLLSGKPLVLSY